ncbi:hypothetical protein [Actinocatenispora sera]|uniref:Protein kinase domain-containing protein n=1 Tax=Actinocatenispora sera TaxID=390989 RepID=A0A810L2V0_9ACTN|nr:hypothetical protein [Actinocatenispora sera]BCJ28488.1 hypothetical protein Asera_25960 [Actinocatenispora sera]
MTKPAALRFDARIARYGAVTETLSARTDEELVRLVDGARPLAHGIGGTSALLEVDGTPVFVKRVPLSDRERRPEHLCSTANLFDLPTYCQYGVGGHPGFGVWREVAANTMTTDWVRARRTEAFPLLYHWRMLPGSPPLTDELADVDGAVEFLHGSPAVRERIEAAATASASIVLFLEYVPDGLTDWLLDRLAAGPAAIAAAAAMVERRLRLDLGFLNDAGLLHFDAHFGNVRTDGERLYLVDLGLATSPGFTLSAAEAHFVAAHRNHDVAHALGQLINWLVVHVCGVPMFADDGTPARNDYLRRCAASTRVVGAPPGIAALIGRNAAVTVAVNDFYWDLFGTSRTTPYPAARIDAAVAALTPLTHLAQFTG